MEENEPALTDRASRGTAADLVEGFADARITNRELERRWPDTKDRAVLAAWCFVYLLYDDFKTHKLVGANTVSPEMQRTLRLARFACSSPFSGAICHTSIPT